MSTLRMRAMMRRLGVDEVNLACRDIGAADAAVKACFACAKSAECTSWLDAAPNDGLPSFCPNIHLFQAYARTKPGTWLSA